MIQHLYKHIGTFEFEAGGSIENLQVAYHTSPRPYEAGDKRKVIWICHALTANSDAQDWWPELVGPGKLLDTDKYFVICGNMLGSCYGSSGPSSIDPKTGRPFFFDFPKVTVRDIVRALDLVRESLGIKHIDLLIGSSIGGFQALEWSIMKPNIIKHAAYMATGARVSPWLTAFEECQRMALEADQTFRACKDLDGGKEALKCARAIALMSYRCSEGYNMKQKEDSDDTLFADKVCRYQHHQGDKLVARFDAYSYWYLSYSVDSSNVGRGRGGIEKALAQIKADSIVVSIDTDLIFPPYGMEEWAPMIPGAKYYKITSHFGHDGFLLETEQLTNLLEPILKKL